MRNRFNTLRNKATDIADALTAFSWYINELVFLDSVGLSTKDKSGQEITDLLVKHGLETSDLEPSEETLVAAEWARKNVKIEEGTCVFGDEVTETCLVHAKSAMEHLIVMCELATENESSKELASKCSSYFTNIIKFGEPDGSYESHASLSKDLREWLQNLDKITTMLEHVSVNPTLGIQQPPSWTDDIYTEEEGRSFQELGWTPKSLKDTVRTVRDHVSTAHLKPVLDTIASKFDNATASYGTDYMAEILGSVINTVVAAVSELVARELELKDRMLHICMRVDTDVDGVFSRLK
jgi:hypothetical protein